MAENCPIPHAPLVNPATGEITSSWRFFLMGLADQIQANTLTTSALAALDLSTLPTSNPGGGKMWLDGSTLRVGAAPSVMDWG